jgi:Cu2+-exporting ATPase
MRSRGASVDDSAVQAIDGFAALGYSPICIAINGCVVTVVSIADPIRADSRATIEHLQESGWRIGILSGDHSTIVERVARHIGVAAKDARGDLSPEDKLNMIQDCDETTVMVGDGANDAAALAAADVGIAVRGGAEVSLQAAPIYIDSGHLSSVVELLRGSRSAQKLIYATFAVSLAYNLFAVALAASGRISPLVAAVLMPISSVSVLALTLAWPTFRACDVTGPKRP